VQAVQTQPDLESGVRGGYGSDQTMKQKYGGPSRTRTYDQGIMNLLLDQYVTDIQGKATVIMRKVQFFRISSLAKVEDSTGS